ncbi:hypothetical protein ACFGFU_002918 [Salmonella enterica]|nr:hypothetical protein [Salmonella enterica]EHK1805548.1 hypothetical protein [Salmonella enterica]ELO6028311.1 hypothetical protein [Salmonella enterica]EMB3139024.1 hypothetical protein [Salmonella enterica]
MKISNPESVELVNELCKWHKRAVSGCDLMRENADKTFCIEGMGEFTLSEAEQKGFRIGVILACTQFQFPLKEVISLGSDVADDGAEGD